jgi:hypothetical protein
MKINRISEGLRRLGTRVARAKEEMKALIDEGVPEADAMGAEYPQLNTVFRSDWRSRCFPHWYRYWKNLQGESTNPPSARVEIGLKAVLCDLFHLERLAVPGVDGPYLQSSQLLDARIQFS